MAVFKKLPDAEFNVMKVVWQLEPPVTSAMLMDQLNRDTGKIQKLQTLHTLLGRLTERGFLQSEKKGKERFFTPLIREEEYLQFETKNFVESYHGGSLLNLVNTIYQGKDLNKNDIDELVKWAEAQRKKP